MYMASLTAAALQPMVVQPCDCKPIWPKAAEMRVFIYQKAVDVCLESDLVSFIAIFSVISRLNCDLLHGN